MGARGLGKAGLLLVLALAPAASRAEKKKPGLFDFQTWKSPVTQQREAAQELAPGQIDVTPFGERRAEPIALRLRVYADQDYRAGVLHWQTKLRAQVDRLNRVVEPLFSVRFELESVRNWDRSHAGVPLEKMLDELHALDAARDVDWVVGLVTPFHGVATNVHHIGIAPLSSRHFVMRAMDDTEEGKALERELAMLGAGERDKLYADRKAHKELVMFLHEWAHSMGALHVEDRNMLMNPVYDPKQAAFTEFEKRLVELVVERRAADRTKPFPEASELLALVRTAPRDEGSKADRDDLVRLLGARDASPAPTGGPPPAAPSVPAAPVAVPSAAPDREVAACELALLAKRFAEAEKSCLAALAKDPNAVRAHLALGRLGARARRYPDAEKHYRRALLLAPSDPSAWSELGRLYRAMGSETQRDLLEREHEALFSAPLPP